MKKVEKKVVLEVKKALFRFLFVYIVIQGEMLNDDRSKRNCVAESIVS